MSDVIFPRQPEVTRILRRPWAITLVLVSLLIVFPLSCSAQGPILPVYVSPFRSDQALPGDLLRRVTDDFEEFLTNSGQYRVVERRQFGDLQEQLRNEATIQGNPALAREFRARGAQAIIFGKVEHDPDDLSYVFSATLISLSGERLWTRSSSVKQTLVGDRETRRGAIRKLIPDSPGTRSQGEPLGSQTNKEGQSQPNNSVSSQRGNSGGSPSCVRPPQGLVGWWTGDTEENDLVGGNDAISAMGVTHVPGIVQKGFQFSNRGFMELPASPTLANQRFTWLAWVKPDGPGPNNDVYGSGILGQNVDNFHDSVFLTWSAQNNQFRFIFGAVGRDEILSTDRFPPGRFYLVAATYDGRSFRLYVDGQLQGFLSHTNPLVYSSQPWSIGGSDHRLAQAGYPRTWNGVIDEVQAFNRALGEPEIKAIFAAGSSGECKFVKPNY